MELQQWIQVLRWMLPDSTPIHILHTARFQCRSNCVPSNCLVQHAIPVWRHAKKSHIVLQRYMLLPPKNIAIGRNIHFENRHVLQLWYPLNSMRLTDLHVFLRSIDRCFFERNLWTPTWATLCKLTWCIRSGLIKLIQNNALSNLRKSHALKLQSACANGMGLIGKAQIEINQISRHDSSRIAWNQAGGEQIEILCRSHRQDIL